MNGGREGPGAPVAESSNRGTTGAAEARPAEAAALHRLEASRARILLALAEHQHESAPPQDAARSAPRPLVQRLLERARRLPIIRTALAIRDLRRG